MVRKSVKIKEVDWEAYFKHILPVCPWSWRAYQKGLIAIHREFRLTLPLWGYQARIYCVKHSPRLCKLHTNRLNTERPDEFWLWSHPSYGNYSAPVPIFIQQDRATLERLRTLVDAQAK